MTNPESPRRHLSCRIHRASRALACSAVLVLTQGINALDFEAPESVAAPYVTVSAWGISPTFARNIDPIPNAWGAWIETQTQVDAIAPGLAAIAPSGDNAQGDHDVWVAPIIVILPIQLAGLFEAAGLISFAPHADLAWAEVRTPLKRSYGVVSFLGEGGKPHGTLDFAGESMEGDTIAAE